MLICLLLTAFAEPLPDSRAEWSAEQWISEVDARADRVTTLRYSVRRTTERTSNTVEERWRFLRDGSQFRVDYFGDTARQVACDGRWLVDYVPAKGAALKIDLQALSPVEQAETLGNVLQKVAVPGFRVGSAEGVSWTLGEQSPLFGRPAVALHGTGEGAGGLRYFIDAERVTLLRTELLEGDKVMVRTDSTAHKEILPEVWFPAEVDLWTPAEGGEVRVHLEVTKVAVSPAPDPALFDLALDPAIPIRNRP